jgi:hypothetical protein
VALTRAQLLAGNINQGTVLAGQVQGVTQGTGISIASSGAISVDASTVTGLMKLNNPAAYNQYVWPALLGTDRQQLTTDATGNLSWRDADSIPWTEKGQLIVSTQEDQDALLSSSGLNGHILSVDSSQPTGLAYTANYVATVGPTAAALIPAGVNGLRPGSPIAGYFRYNATTTKMEFFDGGSWQIIISQGTVPTSLGTVTSVNASGGTTGLTFTGGPVTTTGTVTLGGVLGVANGGTGQTTLGGLQAAVFPTQTGQAGKFLTTDGTNALWGDAAGGGVTSVSGTAPIVSTGGATPVISILDASDTQKGVIETATLAEAAAGTSTLLALTASTGVPKDNATMAGAAIIPSGTAVTTTANAAGKFRYYTDKTGWFGNTSTAWVPFDQRNPTVTAASLTATANSYVVVTAAGQTISLPSTPLAGQTVTVVVAGTFLDTIVGRGGNNIMGLAENLTLDIANASLQFTYTGNATQGWRVN